MGYRGWKWLIFGLKEHIERKTPFCYNSRKEHKHPLDLQAFLKGFSALTAIPPGQSTRALLIAEGLSDADRATFFVKLEELNAKLEKAEKGRQEALAGTDQVIVATEKQERGLERKSQEAVEQERAVGSAERKLTNNS